MKPNVIFFARDYQADFFPHLKSDSYNAVLITLTLNEKRRIEKLGYQVAHCFEEMFEKLPVASFSDNYLHTSFSSDRYLRQASVSSRGIILGKEISFWNQIFEKHNPHLIVNETVAIEISEVLYILAGQRNIRYLSWMNLSIKNHFYWQSSPLHNSLDKSIFQSSPDSVALGKATEYVEKVRDGDGRPFYAKNLRGRYSLYLIAKNFYWLFRCLLNEHKYTDRAKNLVIFGDNADFYLERLKSVVNSLFFKYDNLDELDKFQVVFYPLHYEPEAALFYMAEFFDNQLANIENFAKCLRHNEILIVKEHPQQPGVLLQSKFRSLKKRVPNLVFLPAEYSTYHLLKRSKLILTLGSTAGIEALILGKPVVVLGKVFYDQYEGVNALTNFDELKNFIRSESNWKFPDNKSLLHFLAQIIHYSNLGNPFPHDSLYSKENISAITNAIELELMKEKIN
jgi:hypothetical protein